MENKRTENSNLGTKVESTIMLLILLIIVTTVPP